VITCSNQTDTKANPYPSRIPNPTTKQHAVVSVQLNVVTCPTYAETFIRDNAIAPFILLFVVIIPQPFVEDVDILTYCESKTPVADQWLPRGHASQSFTLNIPVSQLLQL